MIIIDRFEENFAVCEADNEIINIEKINLPRNAQEGDVLIKSADGKYYVDKAETKKRKENVENKFFELFGD